jgi:hypothetical protein
VLDLDFLMAPASAEQSFHASLSQFRWARGVTDDSRQQAPQPPGNSFSRFYNAIAGDYIPLRSSERPNDEEAWFALSRWDRQAEALSAGLYVPPAPVLTLFFFFGFRLLGFGACLLGAAVCFFVAFMTLPLLAVNPTKFALAFRCVSYQRLGA